MCPIPRDAQSSFMGEALLMQPASVEDLRQMTLIVRQQLDASVIRITQNLSHLQNVQGLAAPHSNTQPYGQHSLTLLNAIPPYHAASTCHAIRKLLQHLIPPQRPFKHRPYKPMVPSVQHSAPLAIHSEHCPVCELWGASLWKQSVRSKSTSRSNGERISR